MPVAQIPRNIFSGCLSIEEFLSQYPKGMWDTGIVFVRQRSTGKIFVGVSNSLTSRVKAMQACLKSGRMRVNYFSKELIDTTTDTRDLHICIKLIPEDALEEEVIAIKEVLSKKGVLFERRRDCNVGEYSFFKVTHPQLPGFVYFARHKNSTPETRCKVMFRQRAEELRLTVKKPNHLLSLAGVVRGKDRGFITKFDFEKVHLSNPVIGSDNARLTLKQLVVNVEQKGIIALNQFKR